MCGIPIPGKSFGRFLGDLTGSVDLTESDSLNLLGMTLYFSTRNLNMGRFMEN
jgi:hypothetical protein